MTTPIQTQPISHYISLTDAQIQARAPAKKLSQPWSQDLWATYDPQRGRAAANPEAMSRLAVALKQVVGELVQAMHSSAHRPPAKATAALAANGPSAPQGAAPSAAAANGATALQGAAPSASGSATSQGALATGSGSAPSGRAVGTDSLRASLTAALQGRPGQTSGRYIGRDGMINQWSDDKITRLGVGIQAAQQFFPNMSQQDLAHLVVAEGSQESSGDTNLNVGNDPGAGQGFMQVTLQSVVKDYKQFGTAIKAPDGSTVVDPNGKIDLADPAQNVALWAWYSRNTVSAGQSLDEKLQWNNAPSAVTRDFGNAQYDWFAGPHNDRTANPAPYNDYHNRIKDYFTQSGFGSSADFEKLLNTQFSADLVDVHK